MRCGQLSFQSIFFLLGLIERVPLLKARLLEEREVVGQRSVLIGCGRGQRAGQFVSRFEEVNQARWELFRFKSAAADLDQPVSSLRKR